MVVDYLLSNENFKKELQTNAKNFLNQYMKFQGESSKKLAAPIKNLKEIGMAIQVAKSSIEQEDASKSIDSFDTFIEK